MTVNGDLASYVLGLLSENSGFSDIQFVLAYENDIKPTPLSKPICAVSVRRCEIGDRLKEIISTGEIVTTDKRYCDTVLSADIYMPYSMGGISAHRLFDRIATVLAADKKYALKSASCYEAEYSKASQAIVVKTRFKYRSTI